MATTADRAANGLADTWSRSELLRARGYDEAVIAGTNGHAPTEGAYPEENSFANALTNQPPALETEDRVASSKLDEATGRTCRGCGASLEGRATVWCGQRCKRRFYENRRRRAPKASTVPRPPGPAPAVPQTCDSLAELVALADRLPAGWRCELAAGEARLTWSKEN